MLGKLYRWKYFFFLTILAVSLCGLAGIKAFDKQTNVLLKAEPATLLLNNVQNTNDVSHSKISFEDRVRYQRIIDQISLSDRFEYNENNLTNKVKEYLKKSEALEKYWQQPVTFTEIQEEMYLLAKSPKSSSVEEIWQALNNDPYIIAECYVRPILVDRRIRELYATTPSFHKSLKDKALAIISSTDLSSLKDVADNYSEATLNKNKPASPFVSSQNEYDWTQTLQALNHQFIKQNVEENNINNLTDEQSLIAALPINVVSSLQEDSVRFYATVVTFKSSQEVKTAKFAWNKVAFETWWQSVNSDLSGTFPEISQEYKLPTISPDANNELVKNSGFETGSFSSWQTFNGFSNNGTSAFAPTIKTTNGNSYALLGNQNSLDSQSIGQFFTIPDNTSKVTGSFLLNVTSEETSSLASDLLEVQVIDPTGNILEVVANRSNLSASSDASLVTFDLTKYKGKEIGLVFSASTSQSNLTKFGMDEVAVKIEPLATNFNISFVPPTTISINAGQTANYILRLTTNNLNSNLSFDLEVSPSPGQVTTFTGTAQIPSTGTVDIPIGVQTTTSTIPGTYSFKATVSSATESEFRTATLIVIGQPDFDIDIDPSFDSVDPGGSTSFDLSITRQGGFSSPITFKVGIVQGDATGITVDNLPRVTGSAATQTLRNVTFKTSSNTPPGTVILVVQGTSDSGTVKISPNFFLTVNRPANPDFTLSVSPGSQQVTRGQTTGDYRLSLTALNGFDSNVTCTFDSSSLPTGTTIVGANGAAISSLTVSRTSSQVFRVVTTATTPIAPATIRLAGTGGGISNKPATFVVDVQRPQTDFKLQVLPLTPLSTTPGGTTTDYTLSVTDIVNGFNSDVICTFSGLPTGASVSQQTLTVSPSRQATFRITTSANTPVATSTITVTGIGDGLTRMAQFMLQVVDKPDFTITATTNNTSPLTAGQPITGNIQVSRIGAFAQDVVFSFSFDKPQGLTPPSQQLRSTNGANSIPFQIATDSLADPGQRTVTVTGVGNGVTRTAMFVVTLMSPPFNFTINVTPTTSKDIVIGANDTYMVKINPIMGFPGMVNLSATSSDPAITGSFSPSSVGPTGMSTLTVNVGNAAKAGPAVVTITGTSGSLTNTAQALVNVLACPSTLAPLGTISLGAVNPGASKSIPSVSVGATSPNCFANIQASLNNNLRNLFSASTNTNAVSLSFNAKLPDYTGQIPAPASATLPSKLKADLVVSQNSRQVTTGSVEVTVNPGIRFVPGPKGNQLEFTKTNKTLQATFYIYDSNASEIRSAKYEFFDSSNKKLGEITVDQALVAKIAGSPLRQGQAFAVVQDFIGGVSKIASIKVTVSANSGNASPSASVQVGGNRQAARVTNSGGLILPTITLNKLND